MLASFFRSRLAPFKHRSFRRFFIVQSVSQIGTWSHELARTWIVLDLMGAATALGTLMLSSAIPSLFLILQGGVLVDRMDVKKLMIITKATLAATSIALFVLVEYYDIQFWHLVILAILQGAASAFDSPAYQALAVRLVPQEDFQQALALNSMNFHTGRTLGPLVAGLLMAWYGPSSVFLFDGISYFGLIFILSSLSLFPSRRSETNGKQSDWAALLDGFRYMLKDQRIRFLLMQLLITICLIFPVLIVVFRTYIKLKFELDAAEFGYVFAFPAFGAMMGAFTFTAMKPKRPIGVLAYAVPLLILFAVLTTYMENVWWASSTMAVTGFFAYMVFSSLTVSTHLFVKEDYRGRVGSIIGMCFLAIGPLMGFPIGALADYMGYEMSIYLFSALFLLASFWLAIRYRRTTTVDE